MENKLLHTTVMMVIAPLVSAILAGIFGKKIGRSGAHWVTIVGVGISLAMACLLCKWMVYDNLPAWNQNIYTWAITGGIQFNVGFLIDRLSAMMVVVVTFVSFLVHIYSVGYMQEDAGYQRFFSYISLFTFAMLMLATSNNFMQLYFGWEGVGLASYLLIGFWFKRESAVDGSLKAFLVNRVGDFGFLLGIALVMVYAGTVDYATLFTKLSMLSTQTISIIPGHTWSVVTVATLLLFVGAMGKSAQVPLHVWLPESMEGPTPISALIHAATMVTAGIFMVCRLSPLYELSSTTLSVILIIGSTGALFMGILGLVQFDIKRVVAYSTLSQLGYMVAGLGASAFTASMFHLITHACFKALLFLGAGSVIIAMHHEQDMRKMGGLWRYMPITYVTYLIGSLSLAAFPPFSGFYSKDMIVDAVGLSTVFGSHYAHICLVLGAFFTSLYTFRSFFMTFHGKPRMDHETLEHVHESPFVVWFPLVVLAIPSVILGAYLIQPLLFTQPGFLGSAITIAPQYHAMAELSSEFHGALSMALHAFSSVLFWLSTAGFVLAYVCYILVPSIPEKIASTFYWLYRVLINKYGFDLFNQWFFVGGTKGTGEVLYHYGDQKLIDGLIVNGSAKSIGKTALWMRWLQNGYLYRYVFFMMLGIVVFVLSWLLKFNISLKM